MSTLDLEVLAEYSRWFWHHDFGFPGVLNDLNIWDQSELMLSMINGVMNELDFDFILNNETWKMLYYLVDGIYPELDRFLKTIPIPVSKKNLFSPHGKKQRERT